MATWRRSMCLVLGVAFLVQAIVMGGLAGSAEAQSALPEYTRSEAMESIHEFDSLSPNQPHYGVMSALPWDADSGFRPGVPWVPDLPFPQPSGGWSGNEFLNRGNPPRNFTPVGVSARMMTTLGSPGRYASLWADIQKVGSEKTGFTVVQSGYQVSFIHTSFDDYEVSLYRWDSGVRTTLASIPAYELKPLAHIGLGDFGEELVVFAESEPGAGFEEVETARDAAYDDGYPGIEGAGIGLRLREAREGPLNRLNCMSIQSRCFPREEEE
jgi:hypothetical protein